MTRALLHIVVLLLASALSWSAWPQSAGTLRVVELNPRQPTSDPERIVVTEYFSYHCPHCFSFSPILERWVRDLPEDVLFERVAVSIGHQPWAAIARAFYALDAMGKLDALDAAIFRAIHVDRERLYDKESIVAWAEKQGVDGDELSRTYDSFSVNARVQRADQLSRTQRIPSIPTLVIDGRYIVPVADDGTAAFFERQLTGVDELIDSVRAERGR